MLGLRRMEMVTAAAPPARSLSFGRRAEMWPGYQVQTSRVTCNLMNFLLGRTCSKLRPASAIERASSNMLARLVAAMPTMPGAQTRPFTFASRLILATPSPGCSASEMRTLGYQAEKMAALQKENKELRAKLSTLRWPRLESFWARGQKYPLPWHPRLRRIGKTSEAHLQYLSGVFDGDGCAYARASSCMLSMVQSYDNAEVLLLLQDSFGGGIYRGARGAGLIKPILQWQIHGIKAKLAAQHLLTYSTAKRAQLVMIASWPEEPACVKEWEFQLRQLKERDSAISSACSWAYCAGFLDADGSIDIQLRGNAGLTFNQKFPSVLEHIQRFLAAEGVPANLGVWERASKLRIRKDEDCKLVLRHMLEAGLRKKAAQARIVLSMTPETVNQVKDACAQLVGNQQFGKRLDEAGVRRACEIHQLQQRAKYWHLKGQHGKASALMEDVQILKSNHQLLKAQLENRELKDYVLRVKCVQHKGWQASE